MAMRLDLRSRTSSSWPTVTTGDAAFDERFLTQGLPEEAVQAALTADIRRWIERAYPEGVASHRGPRRRGGDAEAARWEAAQIDVLVAMEARRTRVRLVVLLAVIAVVIGSVAVAVASSGLL
ncbi:MAG: hypothetical protein AAGF73_06415 [Actinomycetota bacterium]